MSLAYCQLQDAVHDDHGKSEIACYGLIVRCLVLYVKYPVKA